MLYWWFRNKYYGHVICTTTRWLGRAFCQRGATQVEASSAGVLGDTRFVSYLLLFVHLSILKLEFDQSFFFFCFISFFAAPRRPMADVNDKPDSPVYALGLSFYFFFISASLISFIAGKMYKSGDAAMEAIAGKETSAYLVNALRYPQAAQQGRRAVQLCKSAEIKEVRFFFLCFYSCI